jgi:hypothetical protein
LANDLKGSRVAFGPHTQVFPSASLSDPPYERVGVRRDVGPDVAVADTQSPLTQTFQPDFNCVIHRLE